MPLPQHLSKKFKENPYSITLLAKIDWPLWNKLIENHKKCTITEIFKTWTFDKGIWWILRRDREYIKVVAAAFLCIQKDFHSGILNLFEGKFHQSIIVHIIYFSLTDINITPAIILLSIHLPSVHTPKSSSDETLWYLLSPYLILSLYFTSKLFKHEATVREERAIWSNDQYNIISFPATS